MSVITVRIPEELLRAMDNQAHVIHLQRAEYIRLAIEHLNSEVMNKERINRIKKASLRVRKDSMRVNKAFSRIEHDPKD